MGIFNRTGGTTKNQKTTKGFYFGHTEAEGEKEQFFEDHLGLINEINNNRFIFTGRKGAGKSAIAKYIHDSANSEYDSSSELVRYNDINLERLVHESVGEKAHSLIFEWLIQVKIVKLLVKKESVKVSSQYKKLKAFLDRNSGMVEIDKYQFVEGQEKKGIDIKIESLKHGFAGILGKHFDSKVTTVPFYKMIAPLKEIIAELVSDEIHRRFEYWILFDDLDVNFKEKDKARISDLTDLLRIARTYNTDTLSNSKCRILIFLRNDIKGIIEGHFADTAKLFSSYEIPINWYNHESFKSNENNSELKKFVTRRVALNFERFGINYDLNDPWAALIADDTQVYKSKTSFKYVIDHTFYRPRDLILILNCLSQKDYRYPITGAQIKSILKDYMISNYGELKNELTLYFESDEINLITEGLRNMSKRFQQSSYSELIEDFEGIDSVSSAEVIQILYSYSILIAVLPDGNMQFNYRERSNIESEDLTSKTFTLHKAVYHFFKPDRL